MTLENSTVEMFRKQLNTRRDALTEEIARQAAEISDEESFADSIDQAAAETGRAMAAHMKTHSQTVLSQVNNALRRIDDGTFGQCKSCGDEISEARLKAFPFTTLCIDCKAELESEEQRYPGRA